MTCAYRGCTAPLDASQNMRGARFCKPAHRAAEHRLARADEAAARRARLEDLLALLLGDVAPTDRPELHELRELLATPEPI